MPKYTFKCDNCGAITHKSLSIAAFFESKEKKFKCEECKDGVLSQQIVTVNTTVEKSRDQIIMETKEEVRKTVEKVITGDKKAINDIYGDKPNQYKNNGVV